MTPPLDSVTLLWHDSEVARITARGADLVLRFSAAHVSGWHTPDAPHALTGYLAPVELVMRRARWTGDLTQAWGRISQGRIVHEQTQRSEMPLAGPSLEAGRLELALANGAEFAAQALAFELVVDPQARFTESSAC